MLSTDTDPIEYVISETPFTLRRRTRWSECDPAGSVYVVNYLAYAMATVDAMMHQLRSRDQQGRVEQKMMWTPVKAAKLEFHQSLGINERFDMTVALARVGVKTCSMQIKGTTESAVVAFTAEITLICVNRHTRTSIEIPPSLRSRLMEYWEGFAPEEERSKHPWPW
jgi:acyl-CoA thioesterase FadM